MCSVDSFLLDEYDIKNLLVQSSRVYVEYRMFAQYNDPHISQPSVTEVETCPVFNNNNNNNNTLFLRRHNMESNSRAPTLEVIRVRNSMS